MNENALGLGEDSLSIQEETEPPSLRTEVQLSLFSPPAPPEFDRPDEAASRLAPHLSVVYSRTAKPELHGRRGVAPQTLRISPRANEFRRRHFPAATNAEWNDWHWQLRNRITTLSEIEKIVRLTEDEAEAIRRNEGPFQLGVTPYYASLLESDNAKGAIRRTVVPRGGEFLRTPGEADDPLGEDGHSPVPGLVHRYPDRVLFLVTSYCSVYCRYCTRSRMVGDSARAAGGCHAGGGAHTDTAHWRAAIDYIRRTKTVRDVLLSGGDPLTLSDEKLEWLLSQIRQIPHVEMVRIGTKVPVVLPQRITPALTRMLRKFHPLWMSIHFAHYDELTPETSQACERLADAGIPLGSQTVLLAGVNDSVAVMKRLMQGLVKIRVKPYYLYQCDPISGSSHFRTRIDKGLEIIRGLRGHTTGYAVPTYVVDAPGGGGKIPLLPGYVEGRDEEDRLILRNYEGNLYRYPDAPVQGGE